MVCGADDSTFGTSEAAMKTVEDAQRFGGGFSRGQIWQADIGRGDRGSDWLAREYRIRYLLNRQKERKV